MNNPKFPPNTRVKTRFIGRLGTVTNDTAFRDEQLVPVAFDNGTQEWVLAASLVVVDPPVKQLDEDGMEQYSRIMDELEGLA